MLEKSPRRPRPTLTAPMAIYALADLFGLACLALGASWFIAGKGAILANFPTSTADAVACAGGGLAVMFWAVLRILREISRQGSK